MTGGLSLQGSASALPQFCGADWVVFGKLLAFSDLGSPSKTMKVSPGAPPLLLYILSLAQVSGVPKLTKTKSEQTKDQGQERSESSAPLGPHIHYQKLHWLQSWLRAG